MTSGEDVRPFAGMPELDTVPAGPPADDQFANRPYGPYEKRLECARARPMNLDMSFGEEGMAILAQLDEGIYRYTDAVRTYLPPDASGDERKLFYNVVQTSDHTLPLVTGEFYVKGHDKASGMGMSTLERAEAIVDRIAVLTEDTTDAYIDEVLEQIRNEGQLLTTDTDAFTLAEAVTRRHPRLRLQKKKTEADGTVLQKIDEVLDSAPTLPATVGEAIERLVAMYSEQTFTGAGWIKKIHRRLSYTPQTLEGLYAAIAFDPRFVVVRDASSVYARTYTLRSGKEKWPILASREAFLKTPALELARRVLDACATSDLQVKDNLTSKITRGVRIGTDKKQEIIETLLYDPRVIATAHPDYVQIAHTPEDAQAYEQLANVVRMAIGKLLQYATKEIATDHMHDYVRALAGKRQIALTPHVKHMLHNLVIVDPHVSQSQEVGKYDLSPGR